MKTALAIVALFAVITIGRAAHATTASTTGYPCMVLVSPFASASYGDMGYAYVTLYSGPSCTGSFLTSVIACSGNVTIGNCSSMPDQAYALLVPILQAAVTANQKLVASYTTGLNSILQILLYAAGY